MNKHAEILYYLADGSTTFNIPDDESMVLAKTHVNPWTQLTSYYLKFENGKLVNPRNRDVRSHIQKRATWHRVKPTAFRLYVNFLQTHRETNLHKAEREL